jgi:hypothetical protein
LGLLLGVGAALPVAAFAIAPASANAARVLVMDARGHVAARSDRFLHGSVPTLAPAPPPVSVPTAVSGRIGAFASRAAPPRKKRAPERTLRSELARLYRTGQISQADYQRYSASFTAALNAVKRLSGTRAQELKAVIENLHGIAASGQLTPSRLPAMFLTLDSNRQWWASGPIPPSGQLIEFQGSQLAWEYYPGQGVELQVLGTFGRADGLYTAGPSSYPQLRELLAEMVPLAARRAGGLAWEYYFHFDGGNPPWVSAMAQGTALEALTRAALAFGPSAPIYLPVAHQALPLFAATPPAGVNVATQTGSRYLQYSFAPGTDILNAFLQSLIGLYDYWKTSGDAQAGHMFTVGNAQAEAELPQFDTGAWSLYQPGVEDSLSYHELVTGFLDQLCFRTSAPVYCTTAQHFHAYVTTPPVLHLLTATAPARTGFSVRFRLSKFSHVGIVITRGQSNAFLTGANFAYGTNTVTVPGLPAGTYGVRLAATDLAGNFNRVTGSLVLTAPKKHPGGGAGAPTSGH